MFCNNGSLISLIPLLFELVVLPPINLLWTLQRSVLPPISFWLVAFDLWPSF